MNLQMVFERNGEEFLKFETITNPRHKRPDLCAFLMLDDLLPGDRDMVSSAEHDEIFLGVDCEKLAEIITEDQIRDLVRCGVRYSEEYDGICMFV